VDDAIGRLGPIGDSSTMAANILELWSGDVDSMRQRALAHARQFGWDKSMDLLFGEIYPLALRRAAERDSAGAGVISAAFADA
jgi:hypothetical protein